MNATAENLAHRVRLTYDVSIDYHLYARLTALTLNQQVAHTSRVTWPTSVNSLSALADVMSASTRSADGHGALLDLTHKFGLGTHALLDLQNGTFTATISTTRRSILSDVEVWLRDSIPPVETSEAQQLLVHFWTHSSRGPRSSPRSIEVPRFVDVAGNYPQAVRSQLEQLMSEAFRPGGSGQLILWHGPPGTGKTYALRALGWEWREWCDIEYVIDPEVFFGSRADYMVDVILNDRGRWSVLEDDETEHRDRWRLLVLEDTGELLSADAKERTGQGLSRLLNLVDGLVGQGMRLLVLVTTNEPLRHLHAAVARPGRCAARTEFSPFNAADADA